MMERTERVARTGSWEWDVHQTQSPGQPKPTDFWT